MGTAIAGPEALTSAPSVKKVKKIATKRIQALAPTLHVASADRATTADTAGSAQTATSAQSATSAQTATTAQTAGDSQALGGNPAASFGVGAVFGRARGFIGTTGVTLRLPSGETVDAAGANPPAPVTIRIRDFKAFDTGIAGDDVLEIDLVDATAATSVTLCSITLLSPECENDGPFTIPEGNEFALGFDYDNFDGTESVGFSYRVTP